MIVGFWNIQRVSIRSRGSGDESGQRWAVAEGVLTDWLFGALSGPAPDLLFLCEVVQSGEEFAAFLNRYAGYEAEYMPVPDQKGNPSPCSFLVFGRKPLPHPEARGASSIRPYILVQYGPLALAGVHLKASNPEEAALEALSACDDIGQRQALVIGDTNYPFTEVSREFSTLSQRSALEPIGYRACDPGVAQTFRNGKVLDYAFASGVPVQAVPPYNAARPYPYWDLIDHAPIAYDI